MTPPRIRGYHPTTGTSHPGGINNLELMDQDRYLNICNMENLYYPFMSSSEWELANWLTSGTLSQKDIDWYLRLPYNLHCPPSFCTASDLHRRVESLPEVPCWHCTEIKVVPYKTKEPLFLYWQDSLEVIKHLFSNLVSTSSMDYTLGALQHRITSLSGSNHCQRVYGEFMSADRAWEIQQDKLPTGHSFVGVIRASDKTPLTMRSGNKEMHPLLLSLANIHANV
ncbi:hypothetical protein OG21DRAFT_1427394, partial [Imleria badia]